MEIPRGGKGSRDWNPKRGYIGDRYPLVNVVLDSYLLCYGNEYLVHLCKIETQKYLTY